MNTTQGLCVVAELVAQDGKREELIEIFKPLIEKTRQEPGCILYDCTEETTGSFVFVEKYKTAADLDLHMASDHFQLAFPQVQKLIVGDVNIRKLPVVI